MLRKEIDVEEIRRRDGWRDRRAASRAISGSVPSPDSPSCLRIAYGSPDHSQGLPNLVDHQPRALSTDARDVAGRAAASKPKASPAIRSSAAAAASRT